MNEEKDTVTLLLDGNEEVECAIISIFEAGDKDYIALLPLDSEDGEVYLYRYLLIRLTIKKMDYIKQV